MTNTNYIGSVQSDGKFDRIAPRYGYKVVSLKSLKDGHIKIVGPHHSVNDFELSDNSLCSSKHKSFENCSCGFYAYNNVGQTYHHWLNECGGYSNLAIVQVALSGTVVVAEHGFRAEHQRVTKILMPSCWNCSNKGIGVLKHVSGFMVSACADCAAKNKVEDYVKKFEDFGNEISPEGFSPVQIDSCVDFKTEAEKFLDPDKTFRQAKELIDQMQAEGKLVDLDRLISYTQNAMFNNPQ